MARVRIGVIYIKYISQITFKTKREHTNTSTNQKTATATSYLAYKILSLNVLKEIWCFQIDKTTQKLYAVEYTNEKCTLWSEYKISEGWISDISGLIWQPIISAATIVKIYLENCK